MIAAVLELLGLMALLWAVAYLIVSTFRRPR